MSKTLLDDAFAYQVWAADIQTLRRLVDGDAFYLYGLTGDRTYGVNTDRMDHRELKSAIKTSSAAWSQLLARNPDPDAITLELDDGGFERRATMGRSVGDEGHALVPIFRS